MSLGFAFPLRQLHLWLGVAVIAMALIILGLRALEKRRRARLDLFVEASLAPRLIVGFNERLRRPLFWLTALGFAFLALTFAQPHWGQAWQEMRRQSHDVMVVLDTSESMRAANPLPSRIDRAKQKIQSLLDRAPGDRFGLIAFSGAAALQCPLTHDLGYFKAVLNAIDTDTISMEGTHLQEALHEAVEAYKKEAETTGLVDRDSRAILLISDGEAVAGDAVAEAEKAAEYAHVYVIGVGDPNGAEVELPEWMGRYVNVPAGNRKHVSRLDEEGLERVALAGKGAYIRSTPDNTDVNMIYDQVENLKAYSASSDVRLRLVNRYQWPLAAAIFCFLAEGAWLAVLPWIRRARTKRGAESALWDSPLAEGDRNRG